jgi:hypothetical protein
MMFVMGSGESARYIADESLDAQNSRFDFRGGGATTAMNKSLDFASLGREYGGPDGFGNQRELVKSATPVWYPMRRSVKGSPVVN